jgi:hypothetical protein
MSCSITSTFLKTLHFEGHYHVIRLENGVLSLPSSTSIPLSSNGPVPESDIHVHEVRSGDKTEEVLGHTHLITEEIWRNDDPEPLY